MHHIIHIDSIEKVYEIESDKYIREIQYNPTYIICVYQLLTWTFLASYFCLGSSFVNGYPIGITFNGTMFSGIPNNSLMPTILSSNG